MTMLISAYILNLYFPFISFSTTKGCDCIIHDYAYHFACMIMRILFDHSDRERNQGMNTIIHIMVWYIPCILGCGM